MSASTSNAAQDRALFARLSTSGLAATRWLDLAIVALLVLLALPDRLTNLDISAAKSDEGIRLEQLFMMALGYQPIRELFASQGPLSLHATYPLFSLMGGTLAAARLAVGIYSLVEIAAVYLLSCALGGRLAGVIASIVLLLSPIFLKNSRTALVEIPALVPATLAIAAGVQYARSGGLRWAATGAALLALAVLIKPLVLAAALPFLLALLAREGDRVRALISALLVGATLILVVTLYFGPRELYDQVFLYRVGSASAEGWSLSENVAILRDELRLESAVLVPAAVASLVIGPLLIGRMSLIAACWLLASVGLLVLYSPLMTKHAVVLVPPAAVAIGVAIGPGLRQLWTLWRSSRTRSLDETTHPRSRLMLVSALVCVLAVAAYALTVLSSHSRLRQVVNAGTAGDARNDSYADDVRLCQEVTSDADVILVDEPYLAYLCRRAMPPSLVDPTLFRLRSGTLTRAEVIAAIQRYDVRFMLLWSDGLRDLQKLGSWVDDNYRAVKIYQRGNAKDRAVYLRSDSDFESIRPLLRGDLSVEASATFGEQLRLVATGTAPREARRGGSLSVTSEWEALRRPTADYHVLALLSTTNDRVVHQVERSLGGGGEGTADWEAGRWVIRSFSMPLPPSLAAGEYSLSLALYDSRARQRIPLTDPGRAGEELTPIATVRIR